jgi:hypothetical protein
VLDDHVSFVVGEDLIVRKFKLLDGAVDQLEATENDDIVAELRGPLRADDRRIPAPVRGAGTGVQAQQGR